MENIEIQRKIKDLLMSNNFQLSNFTFNINSYNVDILSSSLLLKKEFCLRKCLLPKTNQLNNEERLCLKDCYTFVN